MSDLSKLPSSRRTPIGFLIVRIALGILFLVAAWLKAVALWDGQSAGPLLSSPRWQIAIIEVETLLGLWLLSGLYARGAWLAAVALFTTLSGLTLYMALDGQQSCKCFGAASVSPWVSFVVDMAAVVALLIWRPAGSGSHPPAWFREALQTAFGAAACLALISGAFLLAADDPARALARLRGESITVDPTVADVGSGVEGEQRELTLQLTNNTDHSIRIVGGTTAGYCYASRDLPITIPAGESGSLSVLVLFRGGIGLFHHPFVLYTDDPKQPILTAAFTGRVIKGASK